MRSDEEVLAELRGWVLGKARDLDETALTGRTPLFEERHLRSVHLPELLLLLERLTGAPIDVEDLRPGDFRDLDTIMARFHARERA
ncbi:MAG TPA: hypothetical protein VHJ17_07140 [Thermomonospora sp.]|nr:hypothetical protein [Thermomonospora sp.]